MRDPVSELMSDPSPAGAEAPILEARGLVFDYPLGPRALDGVDLALRGGELAIAIGPNGSGKSTLMKVLAGLLLPQAGRVTLGGEPLGSFDAKARARRVAVVPQFLPSLPEVRVEDFVTSGRYARLSRWNTISGEDRAIVRRALEECDAADLSARAMNALSGGQRQRVLVARALAQEAQVLLVDEPTSALDPEHQIRVLELVSSLRAHGRAALLATHDLNLASQFGTRLVLLDRGRVVADGSVEEVLRRDVLEPVYGRRLYYGEWPRKETGSARPYVLPWRAG